MLTLPFSLLLSLNADVTPGLATPGDHNVITMEMKSQHAKDGRGEGRKKWALWWTTELLHQTWNYPPLEF